MERSSLRCRTMYMTNFFLGEETTGDGGVSFRFTGASCSFCFFPAGCCSFFEQGRLDRNFCSLLLLVAAITAFFSLISISISFAFAKAGRVARVRVYNNHCPSTRTGRNQRRLAASFLISVIIIDRAVLFGRTRGDHSFGPH